MSLRLEMLQVARLAPSLLEEAADRVTAFFQSQKAESGAFFDRAGSVDLYYTVFGLEGMLALRVPFQEEPVRQYLEGFGDGGSLDFIHCACLARCWACLQASSLAPQTAQRLAERIEACRSADGGYAATPGRPRGTIYHCFMALGAYQDLGMKLPNPEGVIACVESFRSEDGAYANQEDLPIGTTPAAAAAAALLRHLDHPVPPEVGDWILSQAHPSGGFIAIPGLNLPDLLSTATALHALAGMQRSFEHLKEPCLDFLDTLWTGKAFCGSWADEAEDCEYTYYALLALGHLSL